MHADDVDRRVQRGVTAHRGGDVPAAVGADHLDRAVALGGQGGVQVLVPTGVVAALVPAADVVDGQPVLLGAAQPGHQIVDHVLGPEVAAADPAGRAPRERVQLDLRIAGLRLLHQPPLVAVVAVDRPARVLDARLRAVGGIGVSADLGLEDLERGAVAGLEQVVQDLAALRLGIVVQQTGVAAPAADRADAVERPPRAGAVDRDAGAHPGRGVRRGGRTQAGDQDRTEQEGGQQGRPGSCRGEREDLGDRTSHPWCPPWLRRVSGHHADVGGRFMMFDLVQKMLWCTQNRTLGLMKAHGQRSCRNSPGASERGPRGPEPRDPRGDSAGGRCTLPERISGSVPRSDRCQDVLPTSEEPRPGTRTP